MATLGPTYWLLSISPLYCVACRNGPSFVQQALRLQCLPGSASEGISSTSLKRLSSSFAYRIGASYSAKGRRYNPKEDTYAFNPLTNNTYTGRPNSGQDAFFVSNLGSDPTKVAFGVADGVGGWADSGIDSADFSHGLCESMSLLAGNEISMPNIGDNPESLLQKAYDRLVSEGNIIGGGSTACVAIGDQEGSVSVANLGDSGFIHFRLNAVHYFSNPQTHAFNTPFQLSIVPPRVLALSKIFGGEQLSDSPHDSNLTHHDVRHGDVLIFATDGVWDNLGLTDLLQIMSRQMLGFQAWSAGANGTAVTERLNSLTLEGGIARGAAEDTLQTSLAVSVVGEAKQASQDTKRNGPFAREVHKFYPHEDYHGGKIDDICVVVAVVVDTEKR